MAHQHRPRNPLLTRVGAMVGAMLLLVPIALSLRDDSSHSVRSADFKPLDPLPLGQLPLPAATDSTLAATTVAPTTILMTTAVPATPAPTEAAVITAAQTDPPTTAAKPKKAAPKTTTTVRAAAPPAAATQSAAKVACGLTYTIAAGDAWSTIATRAKVAMKDLLAANNATIKSLLLPGKNICLPAGAVAPGAKAPSPTTQPAPTPPKSTPPATTQPATPPVTLVPPTTQPPPANTYSKAEVAQIIRDVWPDDLEDEAIRIATRESNLIPTARNSCCFGLFQIYYLAHASWLTKFGVVNAAQLYDPRLNATVALALYNTNGWTPWATTPPTPTTTVSV